MLKEVVPLVPTGVSGVVVVVVKTDETDGLILGGSVVRSSVWVTGEHSETFGPGHDRLVLASRSLKVAVKRGKSM